MCNEEVGKSLIEALEGVPDPRSSHGRRHPLAAVLALSVSAMLSGACSLYAIAQWGRMQDRQTLDTLGFTRDKTPAVSTLHSIFRRLDVEAFESSLARWSQSHMGTERDAIAVDGKALRGIHGEQLPGVRLVAAYAHTKGLVLGQKGGKPQRARDGTEGSP